MGGYHPNSKAAAREHPYPKPAEQTVSVESVADARQQVNKWSEYSVTRLTSLDWLAKACGVAQVAVKDETDRCGLSSFKALGGGLVVADSVAEAVAKGEKESSVTMYTASAGNHGMGVAWGAKRTGCQAVIYLGEGVSERIAEKMRGFGAEVRRVTGKYEASLKAAREDAERQGGILVQDVSWSGYEKIPARIHAGYGIVAEEILEQAAKLETLKPTHVLVNAGVGGFACAVCGYLWHKLGAARPLFICVEPTEADCVQHCSKLQKLEPLPGSKGGTVQVGLNCMEVSPLAWRVLETGVDHFVSVPDNTIGSCMKLLAEHSSPIAAGESGVAGLGVLLAAAVQPALKEALQLDESSRIVVVVCEAPPDADFFEACVGVSPEDALAGKCVQ